RRKHFGERQRDLEERTQRAQLIAFDRARRGPRCREPRAAMPSLGALFFATVVQRSTPFGSPRRCEVVSSAPELMMKHPLRIAIAGIATTLVVGVSQGCGTDVGERPVTLQFSGLVGDQPFACGARYDGIGTTGSTFTALDFRLYLHDVRVVTANDDE